MPAPVPVCHACGLPRPAAKCANRWCDDPARALGSVLAAGAYQGRLRRAILAYKYRGQRHWAKPFALLLAHVLSTSPWAEEFSVVCPVPSHVRGHGTGSDHMQRVCQELTAWEGCQWPVEELLVKKDSTPLMRERDVAGRRRLGQGALARSFMVPPLQSVAGARVVLVDDVCATGSTLLAAAGALKRAGAAEVVGLVVARATWREEGGGN